MGIIRHRKDTWTETPYLVSEIVNEDTFEFDEVFALCYMPYDEFNWYQGSSEYILARNDFFAYNTNDFCKEGNSMLGYFSDRI